MQKYSRVIALAAIAAMTLAACGDADTAADQTPDDGGDAQPSGAFVTPEDGATVSTPVSWEAEVQNFTVEQAGAVNEGAGHLHILVDQERLTAGETIGKDEGQNHFGDGSLSGELELEPGEHTLCLQLGDGEHTALDTTDTITITVE